MKPALWMSHRRPMAPCTAGWLMVLLAACGGGPRGDDPGNSNGWETLENKLDTCDPLNPDPCVQIVCSLATTINGCIPSDETLCASVLECAGTYYACTCPDDTFDFDAAAACAQVYDACLMNSLHQD